MGEPKVIKETYIKERRMLSEEMPNRSPILAQTPKAFFSKK